MRKENYFDKLIEKSLNTPVHHTRGTADVQYTVISVMNDLPFASLCHTKEDMIHVVKEFLMQGHYLVRVMGEIDVYFNSLHQFDQYLKETSDVDKNDLRILKGMLNNITRLNHHNVNVGTAGMLIQEQIDLIEEKIQNRTQEGK